LRQLRREEIGLVPASDTHEMLLVTDADNWPLTSGDAVILPANRELAVLADIQALGSSARPGLVAAAVAMARILDNPKAVRASRLLRGC
jgi:hypothetical protein